MSQTRDQQHFTISEVAADWHEPMVLQRIMWPSIARANGQLDPRCSKQTHHRPNAVCYSVGVNVVYAQGRQNSAPKNCKFCVVICKFCAPFLRILRNISTRFSMVQLSVTPVCYPEYRGLLVHLS